MIDICDQKKDKKISFYVFFKNKNDNPQLLFNVAKWWILDNKLDHFENSDKIKSLLIKSQNNLKLL